MKHIENLIDYLRAEDAPENINQIAVILHLLENGGRATRADLIQRLARFNEVMGFFYETVLARVTALDFEEQDVFTYDPKTENYFLNVSLRDTYLKETAIKLCRTKIAAWDATRHEHSDGTPKLVRDGIPQIIESEGRTPITEQLEDDAFREKLIDKLMEEHIELLQSVNIEEIADMMEVLFGLGALLGHDEDAVLDAVHQKRRARGSFAGRVYLKGVLKPTPKTP